MTERISITLPHHIYAHHTYDIIIGDQLLTGINEHIKPLLKSDRVIVVSDSQVARFWLHRLTGALESSNIQCHTFIIEPGETSKQLEPFCKLLETILEYQPDRNTTIIALGGGVVGDMAGFAASCVLRGLPYIQIPTTLLAQVDSAVGGKTAVNSRHGKNLIGCFYQPQLVLTDISTLSTLPERDLKAGYAEILKYALIADKEFFHWLEENGANVLARQPDALIYAIQKSCEAKAAIVIEDEKENGSRALLNFGHTFGHALEAETGMSNVLLHGEAVAAGMMLAMETSAALGICSEDDLKQLQHHYKQMGLLSTISTIEHTFEVEKLMQQFMHDKKTKNGRTTFILSRGIGRAFIEPAPDMGAIRQILEKACVCV